MDAEFVTLLLMAFGMAGLICYHAISYMRDLSFYRRNGWDFSQDSGINHYGNDAGDEESKMSNVDRVYLGHPFVLVCSIVMFAAICFVIYQKL